MLFVGFIVRIVRGTIQVKLEGVKQGNKNLLGWSEKNELTMKV